MEFAYGMNYELPPLSAYLPAAAYTEEGREDDAENHLPGARIALPTGYTCCLRSWDDASASSGERESRLQYEANELRSRSARGILPAPHPRRHLDPSTALLTPREREIALRKERCTREIASRLFISENTVKSALKIIYGNQH